MVSPSRVLKLSVLVVLFVLSFSTYLLYFRHPPPDVLMRLNKNVDDGGKVFGGNSFNEHSFKQNSGYHEEDGGSDDADGDNEDGADTVAEADYWEHFIRKNNFVAVGAVYDKCGGRRKQLGAVILEEDKEEGGVLTRTFFNLTLENELSAGEFHLQVKYNGRDLYDNYWELCEVEDQLPVANRTFTCPVTPGKWIVQKSKHVPSYLPSGRYQTKAWASDEKKRTLVCGYSDFQI